MEARVPVRDLGACVRAGHPALLQRLRQLPDEARRALLDLAYNGGAKGTSALSLASSVRARKWNDAADKVPIRGNPKRTTWRQDMFRQAAHHEPAPDVPQ